MWNYAVKLINGETSYVVACIVCFKVSPSVPFIIFSAAERDNVFNPHIWFENIMSKIWEYLSVSKISPQLVLALWYEESSITSNIISDWDRFISYFVRDWKPEQECGEESLIKCLKLFSFLLDFPFFISWTEAAKEGVSNWRKVWILIMAKNTLMMKGLLVLTNATSVNIPPLTQAIWGCIWKYTPEKNQTNATSVTMHPIMQAHWGHIWKRTVEKSQSNVTTVTLHLQCDSASSHVSNVGTHLKIHTGDKSNSVTSHLFEETFENAQWRKFKCNQG